MNSFEQLSLSQVNLWIKTFYPASSVTLEQSKVEEIYNIWKKDLDEAKYGYPKNEVHELPVIEQFLNSELKQTLSFNTRPTVVLTHDIDYIEPTMQQWLKNSLGRRNFTLPKFKNEYLDSLENYLEIDKKFLKNGEKSHLFIPTPVKPKGIKSRLQHLLIDPTYKLTSDNGKKFLSLINKYEASVGTHASFHSLQANVYDQELKILKSSSLQDVSTNRGHWLNLDSLDGLQKLKQFGVNLDSSLGWNGKIGFRGGFSRPYPILLPNNEVIWELPMLLMDGVLFDEMKLSTTEVVTESIKWLEILKENNGYMALNWHGRTSASDYGWDTAYEEILNWCQQNDFDIIGVSSLERKIEEYDVSSI